MISQRVKDFNGVLLIERKLLRIILIMDFHDSRNCIRVTPITKYDAKQRGREPKKRRERERKKRGGKQRTCVTCFNKSFRKFDIRASNFTPFIDSVSPPRIVDSPRVFFFFFSFVRSFPSSRAVFIYFFFFPLFFFKRFPCFGLPFTANFYLLKRYVGRNISIDRTSTECACITIDGRTLRREQRNAIERKTKRKKLERKVKKKRRKTTGRE